MTVRPSLVALALLLGCSGSASFSAGSKDPSSGTGSEGKPARTGEGAASESAPEASEPAAPAACEPALADQPTALFGTRVLVRMPKGVEIVEKNPFYAQAARPNQATSCGQPVSYAAVGFFEYPPGAQLNAVRDQLLELRGLPAASLTWEEEGAQGRTYTGAYAAPEDAGGPALRGWLVLREANDKYAYFALLETDPGSWAALRPLFQSVGRNFLVKPRAAQSGASAATAPAAAGGGQVSAQPAGK